MSSPQPIGSSDLIELYHCHDARSFRALWALEELGLDYRLHALPFPPRVLVARIPGAEPSWHHSADDRRRGANDRVGGHPAVPGDPLRPLPLAVEVTEADYGLWLDWLHRSEATLTFPQTIVLRYTQLEPEARRLQQAADDYAQWFLSRLRHLTRALADREWLCAGRFTMADLCVGYALLFARSLNLDHKFSPEVATYWQRLSARPAFRAAQAAQDAAQARLDATVQPDRKDPA